MKSTKTYLLEVHVSKCNININEPGNVGLLLRAGKSQSQVTDMKPIIKGIINFNTNIKLNIDQSAIETQRCTLTLNFNSTLNARRVIGIVVINLPNVNQQIQKSFRITSTPDKDALIELCISVKQLDENMRVVAKQKLIETQKEADQEKHEHNLKKLSSISQEQQHIRFSVKSDTKPASPPSTVPMIRSSIIEQKIPYEQLLFQAKRLQRQKEMLKELLKLQMTKSFAAQSHLKNIIDILQLSIGINSGNLSQEFPLSSTLLGESSIMKKQKSIYTNKITHQQSELTLSNELGLGTVKESRFEDKIPPCDSRIKSSLSFASEKSSDMIHILSSMKKNMESSGMSKSDIHRLFDKIKTEPEFEMDPNRVRVLKTKIDRIYLGLIANETITKEQLLKHKIELNKILDDVLNTVAVR